MQKDLLSRYIWLIDTIKRCGRITREELNERWRRSSLSGGRPMPRRTFFNYRIAIEELFSVLIECDPATYEYYIRETDFHNESFTNWMLNSAAMNNVLSGSRDVADRIFLEDVPSAREHLSTIIDAIKNPHPIRFSYHPYSRSNPTPGVVLEPYLLKIFRQRWYVTGRNVKENRIKTYALDRIVELTVMPEPFTMPDDFDPAAYFADSYGIVVDRSEVKEVVLRADSRQAKYLRALPLHRSQREMVGNGGVSTFHLRLRISQDFVEQLLSMGPKITVVAPRELRAMMVASLRESLALYADEP